MQLEQIDTALGAVTQQMVDAGLTALLAFRKSGGDFHTHPAHAVEAAINAALAAQRCCGGDCKGHSAPETLGWQPIDTAPRGKWVYVANVGSPCGGVAMLADYWINPDMRRDLYAERATHWRPLPSPPEVP